MYSLSQQDTSRDNRLNMLVESRVRREVQARFGGEFLETYRRNTARHRVLSLRLTSQYLFLFAAGMLASLLLTMVLYMAGADRTLLPVVTIIIMETFLAKMRRLQGVRKVLLLEEAWKAIAKEGMASYVKYLCAPVQAA